MSKEQMVKISAKDIRKIKIGTGSIPNSVSFISTDGELKEANVIVHYVSIQEAYIKIKLDKNGNVHNGFLEPFPKLYLPLNNILYCSNKE